VKTSSARRSHTGRWLLVVFLLLVFAAAASPLWLAALGGYLVRAEQPVHADMIVVLAGDFSGNRILTSGDLVRRGFAPKALVSGPSGAYGMHESDLAIQFAVQHGFPASYFVALPNDARSTKAEADVVLAALEKQHARSVDIVTSNYHTRRAGNIYRAKNSGLEIHMLSAPDPYFTPGGWWKDRDARKTFLLEWMKTVATWLGM
jgi:uncharacterized SAM-binding protein YcdF (DUF218 family)